MTDNSWYGGGGEEMDYYPNIDMDPSYNIFQQQYPINDGIYPQPQMNYQDDLYKPQNSVQYEFFKAQEDLLLDEAEPMEQGEYPVGKSLPMEFKTYSEQQQQFVPFNGNNNNNCNEQFIPAAATPWGVQLEPVDDLKAKVAEEIDTICKKLKDQEKAKEYSATCLAKKKTVLVQNTNRAGSLKDQAELLQAEVHCSQNNLHFAVTDVLIPCQLDNNSNIDFSRYHETLEEQKEMIIQTVEDAKAFSEEFQTKLEEKKEMIIQTVEEEKALDEEFQTKFVNFISSEMELEKAKFDQDHKDTIPVYVTDAKGTREASPKTLATRVNRSKNKMETCKLDYEAAVYQYKIIRLQRTIQLLNEYWTDFSPYIIPILQNPPEKMLQRMNWQDKTQQFQCLQQLLQQQQDHG